MILIFDFFETLVNVISMDFNRGLESFWEKYYKDKCSFEEIRTFAEEMFQHMLEIQSTGREFPFVKEELPLYAEKFGGDVVTMNADEEADFLMHCNEMQVIPGLADMLSQFAEKNIPMYVISNSGFTAEALKIILQRFGIGEYFTELWSSADIGWVKPRKEIFDTALEEVLKNHPGATKEEIFYIGDTYKTDVIGAYDAGIKPVWINRNGEADDKAYASYEIESILDLIGVI